MATTGANDAPGPFVYDAFLSYTTRSDYRAARKVESFLEGFRSSAGATASSNIRKLEICRDGSDFRLPAVRNQSDEEPVWSIIQPFLGQSRFLIVLCSPETPGATWVSREVQWFIDHGRTANILLAVTHHDSDPLLRPEVCFPAAIIANRLHTGTIFYDLRGMEQKGAGARDPEDELVRLAGDLLDWDDVHHGPLAAIWMREQSRRRRRLTQLSTLAALLVTLLAILAAWQASRSRTASERARANAVVLAADSAAIPLTGVLLLNELSGLNEPAGGMRVAQRLASQVIPVAELRGAEERIIDVAFFDGGQTVAYACADGKLRVSRADGRGDARVIPIGRRIERMVASPAAQRIAVATDNGDLCVMAAHGTKCLRRWSFNEHVEFLMFSQDGGSILLGTEGDRARLLDIASGKVTPIEGPVRAAWLDGSGRSGLIATNDAAIEKFAIERDGHVTKRRLRDPQPGLSAGKYYFSHDGAWVATVDENQLLLRQAEGRDTRMLSHPDFINDVDFSPDDTRVATACSDGLVREWTLAGEKPPLVFDSGSRQWLLDDRQRKTTLAGFSADKARFSPDGKHLASFGDEGVIRIWDAKTVAQPFELHHVHGVDTLAFDGDGGQIAAGNDSGSVAVWRLATANDPPVLQHPLPLRAVASMADGTLIATVDSKGTARLWNVQRHDVTVIGTNLPSATSCAFYPDGRLATAHIDGYVRVWRGTSCEATLGGANTPLKGVLVTPLADAVVAWTERTIYRLPLDRRKASLRFDGPPSVIWSVRLSSDGRRLLACYNDGLALVWASDQPASPTLLAGHRGLIFEGDISARGDLIVTVGKDGGRIWHLDEPASPIVVKGADADPEMDSCAISADGNRIALSASTGRVFVVDRDGRHLGDLRAREDLAHVGPVAAIAFSDDGSRIATAGGVDATLRIWHSDGSGEPVELAHDGAIIFVKFTKDGRVVSGSEDGTVHVRIAEWRRLVEHEASRTTATLTVPERMALLGEAPDVARRKYEAAERSHGRTPLTGTWKFSYPSF
jgi:WD40 repeat protein